MLKIAHKDDPDNVTPRAIEDIAIILIDNHSASLTHAVIHAHEPGRKHPNDFLNYGYTLLRAATAPNRQYNRAPLHGLPAERHGQGVLGNLQPFRQHQGSEKKWPKSQNFIQFF